MRIHRHQRLLLVAMPILLAASARLEGAELSVGDVTMLAGTNADVVVSGTVTNEVTYGVTILVELESRVGNTGTVVFTLSPPLDIVPGVDPWPSGGAFSAFDTDSPAFSDTLNGSVDDDGNYVCTLALDFSDVLSTFPVTASADAEGVWDVRLSTSVGDSNWECLTTTLTAGTITVSQAECIGDADCDDTVPCTDDTCVSGSCVFTANDANCPDDAVFCNGTEVCSDVSDCISTGNPCQGGEFCNETTGICDECQVGADCDDGIGCTDDACSSGSCTFTPNDANCTDNGTFCDGLEICDPSLDCLSAGNPCQPGEICDEPSDGCVGCTTGAECDDGDVCTDDACNTGLCGHTDNTAPCDDGMFCTATDLCSGGVCIGGGDPCSGQLCDEANDLCLSDPATLTVNDLILLPGGTAELLVSGGIAGEWTYGVTIMAEIVSRAGNVGTVTYTLSPPVDIVQRGDPWPGAGIFSPFDTDSWDFSETVNGSVDDNGSFIVTEKDYSGLLTGLPVTASAGAGGVWDVLLTTSVGDSSWEGEGLVTTLNAGTITVPPSTFLSVGSRAMPPGSAVDVVVYGAIDGATTSGVSILLEIVGRPGNVGTLEFTPALDIAQLGYPWGGMGTFSAFDTTAAGFSTTLNGSIHGTFTPGGLVFSDALTALPVVAGVGADGVWDLFLTTSAGTSGWDGVGTVLEHGTMTVGASACATDVDCDDGNDCTDDVCDGGLGTCSHSNIAPGTACGDPTISDCTDPDTCDGTGVCQANDLPIGLICTDDGNDCTDDLCDGAGACLHPSRADGSTCADEGNDCTDDVCSVGVCTHSNLPSDTPCGDPTTNDCSDSDICDGLGGCQPNDVAAGIVCTDDLNECTDDVCDGAGSCTHPDLAAGTLCTDDLNECTDDVCDGAGACTHPSLAAGNICADDLNECTDDVCDGAGACTHPALAAGTACGDPTTSDCTDPDTCDDFGACQPNDMTAGTICTEDLNSCSLDMCSGSGTCTHPILPDGRLCDDADACRVGERCMEGLCSGGSPPNCSTFDDQCNTASCDPFGGDGNCDILTPLPDGTGCDDTDPCTLNDACLAGICGGFAVDCSGLTDICNDGVCDPGSGVCLRQPANEGGVCDDGLPCTTNDRCSDGTCSGTLTSPSVVNLTWSPAIQTVQVGQSALIDLVATADTCMDQPVGGIDAILNWDRDDLELLRRIRPVPSLWLSSDFPNDSGLDRLNADCGEDLFCNPFTNDPFNDGTALYQAVQSFQTGVVVPPSGVVVVTFEFQALRGSHGTSITIPPTAGFFTESRVLGAGVDLGVDVTGTLGSATILIEECQANPDCDDGNVCTNDTCNAGVCEYTNNTLGCDDGLFCTNSDVCGGGMCLGSGDPCVAPLLCSEDLDACVECLSGADCVDGNLCTDDVCNAVGACENPNNTVACDDGVFCTAVDTCSGGLCVGNGDTCPGAVCDEPNSRCVECLADGDCDDANICTDDSCNGNFCDNIPNSLLCDDGLFCTLTDTCVAGECVGTSDPCLSPFICSEILDACVECESNAHCNDGNPCTTDVCSINVCFNIANVIPCDDGLFCTINDTCSGGACVGTPDTCPGLLCDESNARCVECFTVADCSDDQVGCTVDACVDSNCIYPPDDMLCDDGLFCNGPEFCHTALDCQPGGSPCDDPNLCNEANDSCGCREPIAVGEGSRFVAVTPRSGSTPVALLVTGVDIDVSCVSLYAQPDGSLGPAPVFRPPSGPSGWGTVHIRGREIIPSTSYLVETECETGAGLDHSTTTTATTWRWGDTDNIGELVDVLDMNNVVDGFQGVFVHATLYNVELWGLRPEDCTPQMTIDILDMGHVVDAFRQYPFICDDLCP